MGVLLYYELQTLQHQLHCSLPVLGRGDESHWSLQWTQQDESGPVLVLEVEGNASHPAELEEGVDLAIWEAKVEEVGDIAERPWLHTHHFLLNPFFLLKCVDNLGQIVSILVQLSLWQESVVKERTTKVSQIALHLLKVKRFVAVHIESNLSISKVPFFKQLSTNFLATLQDPFVLNPSLRKSVSDIDETWWKLLKGAN